LAQLAFWNLAKRVSGKTRREMEREKLGKLLGQIEREMEIQEARERDVREKEAEAAKAQTDQGKKAG
jgi:hypothetical protein